MIPILVAIALIPRLLYAWYHPGIIFTPDSAIYYDFGRQLLSNFTVKFIFNPFKAPLYGIANFFSTPDILVILQMGIGILTTILVYRLSKNFLVATLASWNMLVIPWERAILSFRICLSRKPIGDSFSSCVLRACSSVLRSCSYQLLH